MKERRLKVCPKCGSTNVTSLTLRSILTEASKALCNDCNYEGIMPEIKKSKLNKFKKTLKK